MPDQHLVLMVLDPYGMWPILAAIAGPSQKTGHHVLLPLQPFEADHRDSRRFRPAFLDATPCKLTPRRLLADLQREAGRIAGVGHQEVVLDDLESIPETERPGAVY